MKKRWLVVLILTLACIAVVLTVSWQLTSVDKLLRPPKPGGKELLIQQAFEEHISYEYQLENSNKGPYNTAYSYVDIDDNGTGIAAVTYSKSQNPKELCIAVLNEKDGRWSCIADLSTGCNEIEYINFIDMNNDSKKEIIVQCSLQSILIYNHLLIYEISDENDSVKKIYECNYDVLEIIDIDSDSLPEIVKADSVTYENTNRYKLSVNKFINNDFAECDSIMVNESLDTLSYMHIDEKADENARMIYLDGYKASDTSVTYFYVWDNTDFKFHTVDNDSALADGVAHNMSVGCRDINKDGFIEFPCEASLSDSEIVFSGDTDAVITTVLWSRGDRHTTREVLYQIHNNVYDYTVVLNKQSDPDLTFVCDVDKGTFDVYTLGENNKRDKKVFTVYSSKEALDKHEKIYENNKFKHYVFLDDNAHVYGFDIEKIKDMINFR